MSLLKLLPVFRRFFWTLVLFTYSDFKTIVLPVTVFACAAAPVQSAGRFMYGVFWIWLHLLQVDVSNQYRSIAEDAINRPWRPLPGGRMSQKSAALMRWLLVPICIFSSLPFGRGVGLSSISLTLLLVAHDEIGFAGHWISKNLINSIGYLSFEFGATNIMNVNPQLDRIALQALTCSGLLILTTIHAQDFSDVHGDMVLGRLTLPIYAPSTSRVFTLIALGIWSVGLGWLWNLGPRSQFFLCGLGGVVGWRFFRLRTPSDDASTFIAYNFWLLLAHALPVQARWGVLKF
ncbi:UbiA prenyltransferase family [Mycena latifolia]|nr:UbiA prenyltransferase family [Mycena latifolia]